MTLPVSVVIPCYNAARWVADTLECLLAARGGPPEIIAVDDGSTDGTWDVLQRHVPRGILARRQANRGASAARNEGLRHATREYVQFLDADDLLSPDKLAAQVELLSRPEHQGCVATCRWGRFSDDPAQARFVDDEVFRDFAPLDFLRLTTATNRMMHPGAWLVPRAVIDRAGAWDESLSLNDDGEYFARVVLASRGIVFSSTGCSYYRSQLAGSLSRSRSARAMRSLHRSAELTIAAMLRAEDSPLVRQAAADFWQHIGYELYPDDAALSRDALRRARQFGGSKVQPCGGARQQTLGRFLGWRLARRLARLTGRW